MEARLLDCATDEFLEHGYGGASVARIIRAAGVSSKTVYARYRGKQDLLLAVVDRLLRPSKLRFAALFEAEGADVQSTLLTAALVMTRHWASPTEIELYRLIVAESARFPEIARAYVGNVEALFSLVARYLECPAATALLDIDDVDLAAREFGLLTTIMVRDDALLGTPHEAAEIEAMVRRGVATFIGNYRRRS